MWQNVFLQVLLVNLVFMPQYKSLLQEGGNQEELCRLEEGYI